MHLLCNIIYNYEIITLIIINYKRSKKYIFIIFCISIYIFIICHYLQIIMIVLLLLFLIFAFGSTVLLT